MIEENKTRAMYLSELLSDITAIDKSLDRVIKGLELDSRKISDGYLFVACNGAKLNGCNFIAQAVANGAVAVICDETDVANVHDVAVPVIGIANLKHVLGLIAAKFYAYPTVALNVVGVTGTNGKTSVTHFLAWALQNLGVPCGVIGTLGMGFPDKLEKTINTTPDPITLQRQFAALQQMGAQTVAIEVSSDGLAQDRLQGVEFNTAIFTNLTRDHLDSHVTMENYAAAKKKLFTEFDIKHAIINIDDQFGGQLLQELSKNKALELHVYSADNKIDTSMPAVRATEILLGNGGIAAKVATPWGSGILQSSLLGRFNVSNLLAVLTVLGIMGADFHDSLRVLSSLKPLSGRMQSFGGGKVPLVVVDYAHTPDALEKALTALREHCRGRLWCVFGCGGDRDRGKRPLMGQIVERLSDQVVITDDNPRMENAQRIVDDIVSGLVCPWAVEVEHDRRIAISHAIHCAQPDDVILVAGKGHESYQIIGDERIPFNDADVVLGVLSDLTS